MESFLFSILVPYRDFKELLPKSLHNKCLIARGWYCFYHVCVTCPLEQRKTNQMQKLVLVKCVNPAIGRVLMLIIVFYT